MEIGAVWKVTTFNLNLPRKSLQSWKVHPQKGRPSTKMHEIVEGPHQNPGPSTIRDLEADLNGYRCAGTGGMRQNYYICAI